ncbi:unnamed protein product [Jaminaea pallidilutea]
MPPYAPTASASSTSVPKRKRQLGPTTSDVAASLPPAEAISSAQDADLELPDSDEDEGEDGDDETAPAGDADESDNEAFPEIDAQSSDEADEEDEEDLLETDSDAEEPETEGTDEYDDEQEEARVARFTKRKDATEDDINAELDKMVQRASGKPNEAEHRRTKLGLEPWQAAPPLNPSRNADGSSKSRSEISNITGEEKKIFPEIEPDYDSDSSTEDAPNRVGNVPLEWYDDLPHIGYDVEGRKVMRPARGDELDKFLATVEDPSAWTSAEDKLTGNDVQLSSEELDIIRRLQRGEIADAGYDPYEDYVDWFTGDGKQEAMPMSGKPEPKRRFVPSKWEHKKVMKIVRAIRQGRITPGAPAKQTKPSIYDIWSDADAAPREDHPMHLRAPKLPPPGTSESYNPPAEYLFTDEERKAWEEADKEDRKTSFVPAKHSSLRVVGGYQNFMSERFERCLDLYMAPRMRRKRLDISDPDELLPKLPSPQELKPFPSTCSVVYRHPNNSRVRCVAVDPRGAWLATGADDGRVRLWDLQIGRCAAVWDLNYGSAERDRSPVHSLEWCPNKALSLLAAVTNNKATVLAPPQLSPSSSSSSAATSSPSLLYATAGYQPANAAAANAANAPPPAQWVRPSDVERSNGVATHITFTGTPKQVTWHAKGDYFATVASDGGAQSSVLIHQLSRQRSQAPFRKASKGSSVQKVAFHPNKPHLFVATQRYVRCYDLSAQTLIKTLQSGLKWISSLDVHPTGDHLIIGSYDKRLCWFDLDLSTKPYKTLRYHSRAIRSVGYSKQYPLFSSSSDDGTVHVFHGRVYNEDYSTNALIVPLKVLRGHEVKEGLGVLASCWVPGQPWMVTAGADGTARLWTT